MNTLLYASVPVEQLPFKDKRPALVAVGVIWFLIAAFMGCATLGTPLALVVSPAGRAAPGLQARELIPSVVLYLLLTVCATVLGVGAVRARRWVRPVLLAACWTWLVSALVSGAIWLLLGPGIATMMQAAPNPSPKAPSAGTIETIATVATAVTAAIMIGIPTLMLLLITPQDVRRTAEHFSRPAWTDGRPPQVIAVSLALASTAIALLVGVAYPVFAIFGKFFGGAPAVVATILSVAVLGVLSLDVLRQRLWAWGATLAVMLLWSANSLVTGLRVSPIEMQRQSGRPQEQLDVMMKIGDELQRIAIAFPLAVGVLGVAYLLYVRRFFSSAAEATIPSPSTAGSERAETNQV